MATLMTAVLGLFLLSVLVVFHELGHFLVARAFGIRVERFSIGFGKPLLQKRLGSTLWTVAAVPLGGFVRMAGDSIEDEGAQPLPDEFMGKAWWQRFWVVTAGPLANLCFAAIAFSLIGVVGYDIPLESTVLDRVGAAGRAAGFAPRDQIIEVDGRTVESWHELASALHEAQGAAGPTVSFVRQGALEQRTIAPGTVDTVLAGLEPWAAARVGRVSIGNPAYKAGLRTHDLVVAVNDLRVDSWNAMREQIIHRPDEDLLLRVERDGVELEVKVHTMAQPGPDGERIGLIGISMDTPTRRLRLPPGQSLRDGLRRTVAMTAMIYQGLWTLVSNPRAVKDNVAGPITIVQMAGSANRPFETLNLLALISLSLMAINLLPIPILDGGHAMFCVIEGLRGSRLSLRSQLAMQKVGLVIIGGLLIFALFNDFKLVAERITSVYRLGRQETTTEHP